MLSLAFSNILGVTSFLPLPVLALLTPAVLSLPYILPIAPLCHLSSILISRARSALNTPILWTISSVLASSDMLGYVLKFKDLEIDTEVRTCGICFSGSRLPHQCFNFQSPSTYLEN